MKKKLLLLTLPLLLVTSGCSDNKCLLDYKLKEYDSVIIEVEYHDYHFYKIYANDTKGDTYYDGNAMKELTYRWQVYSNYYVLTTYSKSYDRETNKVLDKYQYYTYFHENIKWELNISPQNM